MLERYIQLLENLALGKVARLPKFMYRFKVSSVKIPEIIQLITRFTLKWKSFGIAKQ